MYVDTSALARAALEFAARRGRSLQAVTVTGGRKEDRIDRRVKDALVAMGAPEVSVLLHEGPGPVRLFSLQLSTSKAPVSSQDGLYLVGEEVEVDAQSQLKSIPKDKDRDGG